MDIYSAITTKLYKEVNKQLRNWVAPNIKLAAVTAPDNDLGSADAGVFGHVRVP